MSVEFKDGIVWESKPGYAKVQFDDESDGFTTDWLPQIFQSAKDDMTCSTMIKGTQVKCLMHDNLKEGVILGCYYNDEDKPPTNEDNIWVQQFADGTIIQYDKKAHKLTADVKGDTEVTASGDIKLHPGNNKKVIVTGNMSVSGTISATGKISTEDSVEANGDVKAGAALPPTAISLLTHKHAGVQTGTGTSGPAIP